MNIVSSCEAIKYNFHLKDFLSLRLIILDTNACVILIVFHIKFGLPRILKGGATPEDQPGDDEVGEGRWRGFLFATAPHEHSSYNCILLRNSEYNYLYISPSLFRALHSFRRCQSLRGTS